MNGTLTNNGVTRETDGISGTGANPFGLADVTVDVTTLGSLTSLQVERRDQNHPAATGDAANIATGKYWNITPTSSSYTVKLTLPHSSLSDPKVCKHPGGLGGAGWDCARDAFDTSTVWRSGIDSFSDWAVGAYVGPTAVTLLDFRAHSDAGTRFLQGTAFLAMLALFSLVIGLRRLKKTRRR